MEKKETLRQYLTYNKDIDNINQIFYNLDVQLKFLHSRGYYVPTLNSDHIIMENNGSSQKSLAIFMYDKFEKIYNPEKDCSDNIKSLSKLAVGACISIENGFTDYSVFDDTYVKKYYDEMSSFVFDSEYFRKVLVDDDTSVYYSDFVNKKGANGRANSRQMIKSNPYGKMYVPDEEAAFVKIIVYPVLIVTIIMFIAIISKFL